MRLPDAVRAEYFSDTDDRMELPYHVLVGHVHHADESPLAPCV